jgi:hypothetical protein
MTLFSLLYASRSTIPAQEADAAIAALVEVSRRRNLAVDVTGCLIFGAGRFAQVLEGEQRVVEEIVHRVARDPRHTDFTVLEQGEVGARRFAGWALGYAGPSLFVQRSIATPVTAALNGSQRGISDLLRIMTGFRAEQAASLPAAVASLGGFEAAAKSARAI